jgi:hypothetical protein
MFVSVAALVFSVAAAGSVSAQVKKTITGVVANVVVGLRGDRTVTFQNGQIVKLINPANSSKPAVVGKTCTYTGVDPAAGVAITLATCS